MGYGDLRESVKFMPEADRMSRPSPAERDGQTADIKVEIAALTRAAATAATRPTAAPNQAARIFPTAWSGPTILRPLYFRAQ
jgi:hypothetical protein